MERNIHASSYNLQTKNLCAEYMMDAIASCAFGIELERNVTEGAVFTTMAAKVLQLSWRRAFKVCSIDYILLRK